jgi:hypothetical protein
MRPQRSWDTQPRPQRVDLRLGPDAIPVAQHDEGRAAANPSAEDNAVLVQNFHNHLGNARLLAAISGGSEGVEPLVRDALTLGVIGLSAGRDAHAMLTNSAVHEQMAISARRRSCEETDAGAAAAVKAAAQGSGSPLEVQVRRVLEGRLGGVDLTDVRVHTDAASSRAAAAVNASAFTSGRDIFFGAGQYAPQTPQGLQLLAHELQHVVQHQEGRLPPASGPGLRVSDPAEPHEREAEQVARSVARGGPAEAAASPDRGGQPGAFTTPAQASEPPAPVDAATPDVQRRSLEAGPNPPSGTDPNAMSGKASAHPLPRRFRVEANGPLKSLSTKTPAIRWLRPGQELWVVRACRELPEPYRSDGASHYWDKALPSGELIEVEVYDPANQAAPAGERVIVARDARLVPLEDDATTDTKFAAVAQLQIVEKDLQLTNEQVQRGEELLTILSGAENAADSATTGGALRAVVSIAIAGGGKLLAIATASLGAPVAAAVTVGGSLALGATGYLADGAIDARTGAEPGRRTKGVKRQHKLTPQRHEI